MNTIDRIPLLFAYGDALMWVCLTAYALLIFTLIVAVLSENRNPLKALGWVMALLLFPVGGAILYFVFGRSMRNVKMISRRNRKKLMSSESRHPLPKLSKELASENKQRIMLGYSVAEALVYPSNNIEVFNDGGSMFSSLFADLATARHYINLQFYIISNDSLGQQLSDILIERARAGVKIRVIYDYVGSFGSLSTKLFNRLRANGIEVHSFFRIQFPEKLGRLNWRNHRKAVIIDGRIGYIGGINVAQRYIDGGSMFGLWRDMAVRITGPGVVALQHNFAIDWKFMGHELLTDEVMTDGEENTLRPNTISDVMVQIISSGPTNRWGNTHMLFIKAISGAKRRIFIQTPYFMPSEGLLTALQCAALSGVDVRIMLPRKSDSAVLTNASGSYVEESLLAGMKIYFFEAGMLHGKLLLVDDDFVTLGSTNFDYRSFEHNFEENIVMYSKEVNVAIADLYKRDMEDCTLVKLGEWNRRPKMLKGRESLCRLLSPIL